MKRIIICSPLFRISKFKTYETRVVNDFVNLLADKYDVIVVKPIPIFTGFEGFVRRYFGWLLMIINGSVDLSSEKIKTSKIEGVKVHVMSYRRRLSSFIESRDVEKIAGIIADYSPDAVVFHWTLPSLYIAEYLRQKNGILSSLVVHELDPIKYLSRYGIKAKRLSTFNKISTRNEHIKLKVEEYSHVINVLHSYYESD